MDCFVASLLAMTEEGDDFAALRRVLPPPYCFSSVATET
jgi:hypothetical protein